jgi:PiT family inorganic phosphate transporter
MGGYGGAAVAYAGFKALILEGWVKPVLFIFLSPIAGMVLAILLTVLTSWIVRRQRPLKVDRWFRRLQLFSAALFSLGHGTNDSQKGWASSPPHLSRAAFFTPLPAGNFPSLFG